MDRDLERLAAAHRGAPGELGPALAYAHALRRAGDPARAFAVLDAQRDAGSADAAVLAAWCDLLTDPVLPELAPPRPIHQAAAGVRDLAWDAAETRLALVVYDRLLEGAVSQVEVLDLDAHAAVRSRAELTAHRWPAWRVALSPDGELLAVLGDGLARVYEVATGARRGMTRLGGEPRDRLVLHAGTPAHGPPMQFREDEEPTVHVEDPRGTGRARVTLEGVEDAPFGAEEARRVAFEGEPPRQTLFMGSALPFARAAGGAAVALGEGHRWDAAAQRRVGAGLRVVVMATGHQVRFETAAEVTALAFSPAGRRLAIGTEAGEVLVLDLRAPGRLARPAAAAPLEPTTSLELRDLRDPGPGPAASFRLLREVPPGPLVYPHPRLQFLPHQLWVMRDPKVGTTTARIALGPTRVEDIRIDRHGRCLSLVDGAVTDLASGEGGGLFHARAAGPGEAPPLERRLSIVADPAPEGVMPPTYRPAAKARKPRWGRAFEEAHDLALSHWFPAPAGGLWALRARQRPLELWVVDAGDPTGPAAHLVCRHPVRVLTWSPVGGRLAALLEDGTVAVFGAWEEP